LSWWCVWRLLWSLLSPSHYFLMALATSASHVTTATTRNTTTAWVLVDHSVGTRERSRIETLTTIPTKRGTITDTGIIVLSRTITLDPTFGTRFNTIVLWEREWVIDFFINSLFFNLWARFFLFSSWPIGEFFSNKVHTQHAHTSQSIWNYYNNNNNSRNNIQPSIHS